jgi:protein-S-isoprenylcysteine O-methyltransferase Ste14
MKSIQLFIKSLLGTAFFLLILFVSAGRINYWQGWLFTAISLFSLCLNSLVVKNKEELAAERSELKPGTKSWDKKLLGLSAVILIITYIVCGMDAGRFGWSPEFLWGLTLVGAALILSGEFIFLAAQYENKFFSSLNRIQTDRGHRVCDTGIYRVVRHPAYVGNIITAIGIPLILGSLWGLIPSAAAIILTIVRTSFEDRMLYNELGGYREYTSRTRYRLIPYIW